MEEPPKKKSRTNQLLKLLLKMVITVACLWYVSGKINFKETGMALQHANWFYLFLALVAFVISKLFSAIRLNIYFRNINIHLHAWENIKLYWLGMFYNLFLPGSISGDAYKVILLTREYNVPYKKTTAAVLLDRFSGLLGLILILAVYSIMVLKDDWLLLAAVGGAGLSLVALYLVNKLWLKDFLPSFWSTLFWGIAVQAMQVICAYLIMSALGIGANQTEYIFLFLLSSIVAVLPLTIGGLGAREIVFLKGSYYFGLPGGLSVVISLLFYLITLVTSAVGMIYVFKEPLNRKKAHE
jgi:glycosyltransferase 2 family protein